MVLWREKQIRPLAARRLFAAAVLLAAGAVPAGADNAGFTSDGHGAAVHGSGFVCTEQNGLFMRDTAELADPATGADACTYSALSGVYGTVVIQPVPGDYDPKHVLATRFRTETSTGATLVSEQMQTLGPADAPIPVYVRIYRSARIGNREFRTLYASAGFGDWAVSAIVEYSDPQDKDLSTAFLNGVYAEAVKDLPPARP